MSFYDLLWFFTFFQLCRWLFTSSTSSKIIPSKRHDKVINRKLVEEAIENKDFETLHFILKSGYNVRGWSFVGMDLEWLKPITIEELRDKGIIIDLNELLQASKDALSTPNINTCYIVRLDWGVHYLLEQWVEVNPELNKGIIEQLNNLARVTLEVRYKENTLSHDISEYINKKRGQQVKYIFSEWKTSKLSEKYIYIMDEFITDSLLAYWKGSKKTDALNKLLTLHIKETFDKKLLTQFKYYDLPRELSDTWKNRLIECLWAVFDGSEKCFSAELTNLLEKNSQIIVQGKYGGKLPRNTDGIRKEAINRLLADWLAYHTAESITAEIDVFATEIRKDIHLDLELCISVERELLLLLVSDYKQKKVTFDIEGVLEKQIFFAFNEKLTCFSSANEDNPLYALQAEAMTAILDSVFSKLRSKPNRFEKISLLDLLPEWQNVTSQLRDEASLESKERKIRFLRKKLEEDFKYRDKNDYDIALKFFQKAVDKLPTKALVALARLYEKGKGVVKDVAKAKELYDLVIVEANKGDKIAQYSLGMMYAKGHGVVKNDAMAVEYYRKAADQGVAKALELLISIASYGDTNAQYNLGNMYAKGRGVGKDKARAVEYYQKAADGGNPQAQYNLGVMYMKGRGLDRDEARAAEYYQKAADKGHSQAQYDLGVIYAKYAAKERGVLWPWISKIEKKFVKYHQKVANQGYAAAQYNLGQMYEYGHGVAKDEKMAVEYYQKAADQEQVDAQHKLGQMYEHGQCVTKDEEMAVEYYRKAANQGHAGAQYSLGLMYEHGRGIAADDTIAVEYYQKAADQGEANAQYNLGWMYGYGCGVAADDIIAVEYYRKAANQGHVRALAFLKFLARQGDVDVQYNLGQMYEYGQGVTKNEAKAVKCYQKAANQGQIDAQYSLGLFYDYGQGDYAKAVEYYQMAVDQGHAGAQYNLGQMYEYGQGVNKDDVRAMEYYQKAADQGHVGAQYNLGWIYEYGEGVAADETRAVEYYQKAADQGDADAQYNLGWIYEHSQSIIKDDASAVKYYQKAANQEHANAQCNLGWLYECGQGVAVDEVIAVEYYQKAAEQGHAKALALLISVADRGNTNVQCNLGWMYEYGQGVAADEAMAVKYYQKAADQGDADMQCTLGLIYEYGQNDAENAVKFYQKAVDQGHVEALMFLISIADWGNMNAQYNLGLMYEHGRGLTKDKAKAMEYYQKAADQGNVDARKQLELIETHLKNVAIVPEETLEKIKEIAFTSEIGRELKSKEKSKGKEKAEDNLMRPLSCSKKPTFEQRTSNAEDFSAEEIELAKKRSVKDLYLDGFVHRTVSEQSSSRESEKHTLLKNEEISEQDNLISEDQHRDVTDWIIPFSQFELKEELGRGGFGVVYRSIWKSGGNVVVAIKQLHHQSLTRKFKKSFFDEARYMTKLHHPNVVKLYAISTNPYSIVMEFLQRGTLYDILHDQEQELTWQLRYKILLGMARGLAYLHNRKEPILHRDLKSLNVLLDKRYKPKLSDFGLSKIKTFSRSIYSTSETAVGTLAWIAPEHLRIPTKYAPPCDVYSYGIVSWEVMSRREPYEDITNTTLLRQCILEGYREEIPPEVPPVLAKITELCWQQISEKRPTMDKVVEYLSENKNKVENSPTTSNTPLTTSYTSSTNVAGLVSGYAHTSGFSPSHLSDDHSNSIDSTTNNRYDSDCSIISSSSRESQNNVQSTLRNSFFSSLSLRKREKSTSLPNSGNSPGDLESGYRYYS